MSVDFDWQAPQGRLGILEWLRPGEYERAEQLFADLNTLHITRLRTGISCADWQTAGGREWFDWLIPRAAQEVELLPCINCHAGAFATGQNPAPALPDPQLYAEFIDQLITNYGEYFDWLELWSGTTHFKRWDWLLDPEWLSFSKMIDGAASNAKRRGKKAVLAGVCSTDPGWLDIFGAHGGLAHIDAVGLQGLPGTSEFEPTTWPEKIETIREVLDKQDLEPELWLSEVGHSTWREDEIVQVKTLMDALAAPVDRVYWYATHDLQPEENRQNNFRKDGPLYHFGMKTADGTPKLLYRVWQESGLGGLHRMVQSEYHGGGGLIDAPDQSDENLFSGTGQPTEKSLLISGGAGVMDGDCTEPFLPGFEKHLISDVERIRDIFFVNNPLAGGTARHPHIENASDQPVEGDRANSSPVLDMPQRIGGAVIRLRQWVADKLPDDRRDSQKQNRRGAVANAQLR